MLEKIKEMAIGSAGRYYSWRLQPLSEEREAAASNRMVEGVEAFQRAYDKLERGDREGAITELRTAVRLAEGAKGVLMGGGEFKVVVGGKSKLDGPSGKSVEDAFQNFLKKSGPKLPKRSSLALSWWDDEDGTWVVPSAPDIEKFRKLVGASKDLESLGVRVTKASY